MQAKEYHRLGLDTGKDFRVVQGNMKFTLSETYPQVCVRVCFGVLMVFYVKLFVIPTVIDDSTLKKICEYRSKKRVPAVVSFCFHAALLFLRVTTLCGA